MIGQQGCELNKFKIGVFLKSDAGNTVGNRSLLNGEVMLWGKDSQME